MLTKLNIFKVLADTLKKKTRNGETQQEIEKTKILSFKKVIGIGFLMVLAFILFGEATGKYTVSENVQNIMQGLLSIMLIGG